MTAGSARMGVLAMAVCGALLMSGCSKAGTPQAGEVSGSTPTTSATQTQTTVADTPSTDSSATTSAPAKGMPPSSGSGHGQLTYSGGTSGTATFTSVTCGVLNGKLLNVLAPDPDDHAAPQFPMFGANIAGDTSDTSFSATGSPAYVKVRAVGITSSQDAGVWKIHVAGTELGADDLTDPITLNGELTCGRTVTLG